MLCTIYKGSKKEGAYLYILKKDDFSAVPEPLMTMFGKPTLVMTMLLDGKTLARVDVDKVTESLTNDGYFLQMPPPPENLLEEHKLRKKEQNKS
ncbi:YcgL domain-containing protein [Vibrio sp. RC27]